MPAALPGRSAAAEAEERGEPGFAAPLLSLSAEQTVLIACVTSRNYRYCLITCLPPIAHKD